MSIAVGALVGVGGVASVGPVVRDRASTAAARYGGAVEIESVSPIWGGVRLRGIDVTLEDMPSTTVRLDEVIVRYGWDERTIVLRGGDVSVVGAPDVVLGELEAFRARRTSTPAAPASSGGRSLEVQGLDVTWREREALPQRAVEAVNVQFDRSDAGLSMRADSAKLTVGETHLAVTEPEIDLVRKDQAYRVARLAAAAIDADVELSSLRGAASGAGGEQEVRPATAVSATSRASQVRDAAIRVAQLTDGALEPDAEVTLHGVTARVHRGDQVLNLGPGAFRITREELDGVPGMVFALRPGIEVQEGQAKALTFSLRVPLSDEVPIRARVDGGPIHFSTLGIQEGDFGLLDVQRTSLEAHAELVLPPEGDRVTIDGEGKVRELSLESRMLSSEPVRGTELAWRGEAELWLDGSRLRVEGGEVDVGSTRLKLSGELERFPADTDGKKMQYRVDASYEVPLTPCQLMLDSAPKGLMPLVAGTRMAGSFAIKGSAKFDTRSLDKDFDVDWVSTNSCRILEVPDALHVRRFRKPFKRTAYTPDGKPVEVETGPTTDGWVSFSNVSRFMEVGVISCEDGRFHRHDGFDAEAIRNSIRENLKAGRFVRGASTISMQLAKNLYLSRSKNLSRKLQEAILTMYLEQELTKEQILELYLNVVEFGPNLYGVGPAASTYFRASPASLSLAQSMYLASILPAPSKQHFGAGGAVSQSWMKYLHTLMRHAEKRHRITEEELEIGLEETVVRGSPASRRARPDSPADDFDGDDELDPFAQGPVDPLSADQEAWLPP